MSVFELIMLLCFGIAWPFSIRKSIVSKSVKGKSFVFLFIVWSGYLAGIFHKIFYQYDIVIILYIINFVMVCIDMVLYLRNKKNLNK